MFLSRLCRNSVRKWRLAAGVMSMDLIDASEDAVLRKRVGAKLALWLILPIGLITFINSIDRVNVSYAGSAMSIELGLSPEPVRPGREHVLSRLPAVSISACPAAEGLGHQSVDFRLHAAVGRVPASGWRISIARANSMPRVSCSAWPKRALRPA